VSGGVSLEAPPRCQDADPDFPGPVRWVRHESARPQANLCGVSDTVYPAASYCRILHPLPSHSSIRFRSAPVCCLAGTTRFDSARFCAQDPLFYVDETSGAVLRELPLQAPQ